MTPKGESRGYGFVHYESDDSAQNAISRVNGKMIAGETVYVSQFKSRVERGIKTKFTNIFVKNLDESWTKQELDRVFGKYGTVTSSALATDKDGKARGFAYVNYLNSQEAQAAIDKENDKLYGQKRLFVSRHQRREERERELRDMFERKKLERQKNFMGVNLFVKNLSDDIDDERLVQEFQKFGTITSAKVMKESANSKSKGFGFVCFSTPDEATKAVTEMNGRMFEGKPLYVALAQRKDVRRAQLEAQYAARAKLVPHMLPQGFLYQGVPRMVYPQQVMQPRRWNPAQGPQMMPVRGMNYVMPVNQVRGPGGGRGWGGGRGQGGQKLPDQPRPQQSQYKYTSQARNPQQLPTQVTTPTPAETPSGSEPLMIKALAAAPEEQKKQMIGESLFPLIKESQPDLAGKITGMLLEMDNGELLHLLESREALQEKINEALTVLNQHDDEDEDES